MDAFDGSVKEGKMILPESARRKKDVGTAKGFTDRGLAFEADHLGAENRIAAFGLRIEKESLKPVAEFAGQKLGQVTEEGRVRAVPD